MSLNGLCNAAVVIEDESRREGDFPACLTCCLASAGSHLAGHLSGIAPVTAVGSARSPSLALGLDGLGSSGLMVTPLGSPGPVCIAHGTDKIQFPSSVSGDSTCVPNIMLDAEKQEEKGITPSSGNSQSSGVQGPRPDPCNGVVENKPLKSIFFLFQEAFMDLL
ncbi:hypothetical protein MJT46_010019 [Ovis ammon polii x Ovis aries]|nr:hypothetical protein MJT46_010019 [Ovis ammon polii x Ovis aries]